MRVLLLVPLLLVAVIASEIPPQLDLDSKLGPTKLPEEKLILWNETWRERIQNMYGTIKGLRAEKIVKGRPYENEEAVIENEREKVKLMLRRALRLAPKGANAPDKATGEEYEVPEELVEELMGDKNENRMLKVSGLDRDVGRVVGGAAARANSFVANFGNAIQHVQHPPGRVGGIPVGGTFEKVPTFHPAGRVFAW